MLIVKRAVFAFVICGFSYAFLDSLLTLAVMTTLALYYALKPVVKTQEVVKNLKHEEAFKIIKAIKAAGPSFVFDEDGEEITIGVQALISKDKYVLLPILFIDKDGNFKEYEYDIKENKPNENQSQRRPKVQSRQQTNANARTRKGTVLSKRGLLDS